MSPVRVLLVGQDPSNPGGMAKYIGAVQNYLCDREDIQLQFLNETKVKGRAGMTSRGPIHKVLESVRLIRELRLTLKNSRPDVVHLHMSYSWSVPEKALMARICRSFGVPALIHVHGSLADVEYPRWSTRKRRAMADAFGPPHTLIVLSHYMEKIMRSVLPDASITVLPNAVDLPDAGTPPRVSPPCVGFIGFLDGRKGELDLIEALSMLKDLDWCAQIAGDGSGMAKARALVEQHSLGDRVRFLGFVDGEVKRAFFHDIDLLCLPSHAENLPISILEALSYGRAVVATTVGGVPDLVTPECGRLVAPRRPRELADSLAELLTKPELLVTLGESGRVRVERHYTWDVVGPTLVQLYQQKRTV